MNDFDKSEVSLMKYDVSYIRKTTNETVFYSKDNELNYDSSFVEALTEIEAINKVKCDIAELMRCNCLDVVENEEGLTIFEPSDREFIEGYINFNAVPVGNRGENIMLREEMLNKLHTLDFQYIDPPSDWEDIGFTERPIWVNSKGYGYLSCDDPSDNYWVGKGIEQEKWETIRKKLANGTLQFEDIEDTILKELLDVVSYGEFYEDADPCEYLDGLLELPADHLNQIYCMDSLDGWRYYSTEEEFNKAYGRDEYDYAWDELTDDVLVCWINRLFNCAD